MLLHSKLDWIDDPLCQECIVCYKPHPRLFAQPRSDPVLNGQYADCTGGLRISADRMLCGSCCGYMLENRNHSIGARLLSLGIDNGWTHKWHTKWQRGHLTLSVQSRRGMADIRDLSTVRLKHTALWRLFIGLSWCGCTAIKVYLFVGNISKDTKLSQPLVTLEQVLNKVSGLSHVIRAWYCQGKRGRSTANHTVQ